MADFRPLEAAGRGLDERDRNVSSDLFGCPQAFSINVPPAGILLTVLALCVTAYLLRTTRIGLNLKAIGNNPAASVLFGLHPGRYMLLAMIFAGGLAGLAGCIQVAAVYHRLIPAISSGYGYLALLVVMLAGFAPGSPPLFPCFLPV